MLDSSSEDSGGEVVRMDHTRDDGSNVSQSMMSASDVVQMGNDSMVIVGGGSSAAGTNTNTSMASIGMAGLTESQRQGEDVVDEDSDEG